LILLDNKIESLPKFISAQKLLEDKFILEFSSNDKNKNRKTIELNLANIACFVKPHSDFVCDTNVRGILPKRHNGLESPTVYVLVTDNKFDFYNITEISDKRYQILDRVLKNVIVRRVFTIHQLAHFLIKELENDLEKYKSKLVVITGELYPQMIQTIKKTATDSIILVFSSTKLSELVNYG
jgi:Rad51